MKERVILILAGGRATRMGGGDKPLRLLAGRPILTHVLARVAGPGRRLLLNANGDAERLAAFGLPVIADGLPENPGPLAGVLAGLDWAAEMSHTRHVISVPGDCPFLPAQLVGRLEAAITPETPLACAASGGRAHPVIGIWPVALREALRNALMAGEGRVDRFTARFGCARVEWPVTPFDPFFNINTPHDLEQAETIAALALRQ